MTLRQIQNSTGFNTPDAITKLWKALNLGDKPKLDTVLQPDQVSALLDRLSQQSTRRSPETAQAAAKLLAEYRTGQHQNGQAHSVEAKQPTRPVTERKVRTPQTKQAESAQPPVKPAFNWWGITMLDMVYLSTIVTAIYGLIYNLREMGAFFAVPYCLISWHAIRMAKRSDNRRTAQAGIAAVVVLEVLTFFIHLSMFNLRLVDAAKSGSLPFEYSFWGSTSAPFYIACILAGLFSGAGIYAVSVTFSLTSEKYQQAEAKRVSADQALQRVAELEAALIEQIGNWQLVDGWREVNRAAAERMVNKGLETLNKTYEPNSRLHYQHPAKTST